MNKDMIAANAKRYLMLMAGAVLSALGIASFVRSAGLFPGGFTDRKSVV